MATTYDGINYFPIAVNFMEENAMEVIEAKIWHERTRNCTETPMQDI